MKKILAFPFTRDAAGCFVLAPLLGLTGFIDGSGPGSIFAGVLQWAVFVILGVLHVYHFRRRLEFLQKEQLLFSSLGWAVTGGLALEIFLLLTVLYWVTPGDRFELAGVSCTGFLLPFMVLGAWESFCGIPESEYRIWFNPEKMDQFALTQTWQLPVRLKVRRKYFDLREELFPLTVPARWKLGRFFHHFILDEERNGAKTFEKEDDAKNPYGWQFYCADFGGVVRKYLDPQRTLEENRVRKNSIIVARRVKAASIPDKQILATI